MLLDQTLQEKLKEALSLDERTLDNSSKSRGEIKNIGKGKDVDKRKSHLVCNTFKNFLHDLKDKS